MACHENTGVARVLRAGSRCPPPAISAEQTAAIRARPIRDLDAQEAYIVALERDTLEGYSDFLAVYPNDPMARRVRAIIAARREAITWRRTRVVDTPPAYWSYLRRYPDGPHANDARRRLAFLAAAFEPPPSFAVMAYDLPPPPPEEIVYIRRPVLVFDDPAFGFAPPPPAPVLFLAPPPPEFVVLEPPPSPVGIFLLPMPIYRPVPVWASPPRYVAPPPNNVIYNNVHNTVVVNNDEYGHRHEPERTDHDGAAPRASQRPRASQTPGAPAVAAPVAAIGPALPPSVAQKAVTLQTQNPQGVVTPPSGPAQRANQPPGKPGQPLPELNGQPLPAPNAIPRSSTPSAAVTPGTAPPNSSPKPGHRPRRCPRQDRLRPPPLQLPWHRERRLPRGQTESIGCRSHQQPREENQEHHRKFRGRVPRHPRRQLLRNRSQLKPNASSHQCRREGVHNRDRKPRPQNSRRHRLLQSRFRLFPRRPPPVWPSLHRRSRKCPGRLRRKLPRLLQNRRPPHHPCRPQQWSSP